MRSGDSSNQEIQHRRRASLAVLTSLGRKEEHSLPIQPAQTAATGETERESATSLRATATLQSASGSVLRSEAVATGCRTQRRRRKTSPTSGTPTQKGKYYFDRWAKALVVDLDDAATAVGVDGVVRSLSRSHGTTPVEAAASRIAAGRVYSRGRRRARRYRHRQGKPKHLNQDSETHILWPTATASSSPLVRKLGFSRSGFQPGIPSCVREHYGGHANFSLPRSARTIAST